MQVTLNLPDELVAELLENELKRANAARKFGELTKTLRTAEPPITEQEIRAELDARKAERITG